MQKQKQIGKNMFFLMLNFMLPCWNITCYIEHLERLMVQNGLSTLVNVGVSMLTQPMDPEKKVWTFFFLLNMWSQKV